MPLPDRRRLGKHEPRRHPGHPSTEQQLNNQLANEDVPGEIFDPPYWILLPRQWILASGSDRLIRLLADSTEVSSMPFRSGRPPSRALMTAPEETGTMTYSPGIDCHS